jgi:hypothetical protein
MKVRKILNITKVAIGVTSALVIQLLISAPNALAADGDVRLAGVPVFTLQSGAGSTISQRADTIQNNLDNALVASQDRSPSAVGITYVKGVPVITLGGYQVVTLDQSDATAAHGTPADVAQKWSDGIKRSLSNPQSVASYVSQLTGATTQTTQQTANLSPQSAPPSNFDQYNSNSAPPQNYPRQNYNGNTAYNGTPNYGPPPSYNNGGGPPNYGGGYGGPPPNYGNGPPGGYRQGRVALAPAGQVIPVTLQTSISTQVAHTGDLIQANLTQNLNLGDSIIPAGSVVIGQVTDAEAGHRLAHSGELGIKFTRIRTPDGIETPISAHLVGALTKHAQAGQTDVYRGEGLSNKVGSVAFRGGIGAGGGAALGTAVGAIAGGGHGAGMGAWSGAAIGGGLGVADSLLLRKGKDVTVPSGTVLQLQLDSPVSIAGATPAQTGY